MPKVQESPKYQHDCPACRFLGGYTHEGEHYDLYACNQGGAVPTVIARWSDNGPDYTSGQSIGRSLALNPEHQAHPLAEAYRRHLLLE